MNKMIVSALALSAFLTVGSSVNAATELSDNAVVRDSSGQVVHSLLGGTCVRTKWEVGEDICAPRQQASTTTTAIRTELTDDERMVYFAFNSAVLTPAAQLKLADVSRRLLRADDVANAEIVGYADRIGSAEYNVRLSARRAAAVRDYLVEHGYLKVNVGDVRAMGEARPVTSCTDRGARSAEIACLAPDRRVDIQLTYVDRSLVSSTR